MDLKALSFSTSQRIHRKLDIYKNLDRLVLFEHQLLCDHCYFNKKDMKVPINQ